MVVYSAHNARITSIDINRSFDMVISGDKDGVILIWDLEKMTLEH